MSVFRFAARAAACAFVVLLAARAADAARPFPILFVTQVPTAADFTAVASVFGNHQTDVQGTPRGGDLWILYPDGSRKNLTQAAGFGVATGFQGATSIAVREPAVHWSGTKAIFSMLIGAPTQQYVYVDKYWQLYEITGLGPTDTPVITKVPRQPANANNVSPDYLSDGRILFTSDRSRSGAAHLYPQRDEYEEAPTVSGLWALDPSTGALQLLDHAPSGDFKPTVDSFGRVIFTRWDHLQRDQQADADEGDPSGDPYGTFNWSSEDASSVPLPTRAEVFPERRAAQGTVQGHRFNQFFPWMVNQDGSELETLNHVGRHDLAGYFDRSFNNDGNLVEFICGDGSCGRVNQLATDSFLQIRESPVAPPGRYYGTNAPEFYTHAAGQLLWMPGEPGRHPDNMPATAITHDSTSSFVDDSQVPHPCHSGLYRQPLPLSDGNVVALHAGERTPGVPERRADEDDGPFGHPSSRYHFRLTQLVPDPNVNCSGWSKYGAAITGAPIQKTIWWWSPDDRMDFSGTLWELDPVEVRPRSQPPQTAGSLPAIEAAVFQQHGIDPAQFQLQLREEGVAMVISRNVTRRDQDDRQQPFNLRVPGGVSTTVGNPPGTIYDVDYLQLYQADQIRGLGGTADPRPGRRVLAQVMHDPTVAAHNPVLPPGSPPGSVKIAADGSLVAMVPSHRAMTWQLTFGNTPVVRERYWLTFKAGEVRVCASCHGVSSLDQAGTQGPQNPPQALDDFLQWWTTERPELFRTSFEVGSTGAWTGGTWP